MDRVKPILVFAYGNLSRGDDALGPLLLEYIESHSRLADIEILSDFQLQVEHALDLQNRALVLFVDASVSLSSAINFTELKPAKDNSYTTHIMSPAAVLAVFQGITKQNPPPCFLLTIKGERFELGETLSANAQQHLAVACRFTEQLLQNAEASSWKTLASNAYP